MGQVRTPDNNRARIFIPMSLLGHLEQCLVIRVMKAFFKKKTINVMLRSLLYF